MIEYVEIRSESLELLGLIDTAKSIIWETQYFGTGEFEIYTEATPEAIDLLRCGRFVTRVDADGVGIIEAVEIVFNEQDGRMITATGRLAKSILDRRLISYVSGNKSAIVTISGNVEARARGLVQDNAIACYKDTARTIPYTARNIGILQLGTLAGLTATTYTRQAGNENLLTYTDEMLQQYGYGAKMLLTGGKLAYTVYSGADRSIGNAAGNEPVIFSEDFDNLTGSNYLYDETASKTYALVGGDGEGVDRYYIERGAELSGLARRELFVDSSVSKEKYTDTFTGDGSTTVFLLSVASSTIISVKYSTSEQSNMNVPYAYDASSGLLTLPAAPAAGSTIVVEHYDEDGYMQQLNAAGDQELAKLSAAESFDGSIDLEGSSFVYGVDFEIGDIVTVQDNGINKYVNGRVVTVTEVQDDNGYQVNIDFEAV